MPQRETGRAWPDNVHVLTDRLRDLWNEEESVRPVHCPVPKQLPPFSFALAEERIRAVGWTVSESGCWIWNRPTKEPYPHIKIRAIRSSGIRVSRLSYEIWVGPIPEGLLILHTCDQPQCINPEHLLPGTSKENTQDMFTKRRAKIGEAHPRAKLTAADVVAIITEYRAGGVLQRELAVRYGVCQSHISGILTGIHRTRLNEEIEALQWAS